MSMVGLFFIPLVVFLVIVAPVWIICHYITKWKTVRQQAVGEGMIAVPREEILKLRETANKLDDRLATLEKIFDHDEADRKSK